MDWQILFNVIAPIIGTGLIGWVGFVQRALFAAKDDLASYKLYVAERYASHDDIREIKELILRIGEKLDRKADKP